MTKQMNYIEPNLSPREYSVMAELRDGIIPRLHRFLVAHAPLEFVRRGGSCCRQVSVMSCMYLTEKMPQFCWHTYEGYFSGTISDGGQIHSVEYDHAWVWGHSSSMETVGEARFVDFAHRKDRRVWRKVAENEYPADLNPTWIEKDRRPIDWKTMLAEPEYYTGLPGNILYDGIAAIHAAQDETWYEAIRPKWCD